MKKIFISILFVVLCSTACGANDTAPYATPTAYFYPTVSIVEKTPVAFYTENDFDCWRAPGDWQSTANYQDELFLLVSALTPGNWERLYQYIPSTNAYQFVAASQLDTKNIHEEPTSPMRNAFWFRSMWTRTNHYYVYIPSKNLISQIPSFSSEIGVGYQQFSPDGTCLFFGLSSPVAYRLVDGKLQQKSIPGFEINSSFDISPDGKWWSLANEHGLTVVTLDGEEWVSEAFNTPTPGHLPHWSPDSNYIVFDHSERYQHTRLRLIKFSANAVTDYQDIPNSRHGIVQTEWSNNNQFLLVSDESWIGIYDVIQQKWVHEIIGTGDHCFSVNGEKLYFIGSEKIMNDDPLYSGRTEVDRLYVLDLSTNLTTTLPLPEEYSETDPPYLWGLYCTARP